MNLYASGNGHVHLAEQLGINNPIDLTQSGCANGRMIRTTLKDSFLTSAPTLYIIGLTFISRSEAPILKCENEESSFEGRWSNPQNQMYQHRWEHHWTEKDTDAFVNLKRKEEVYSLLDRTEDLMYRLISMVESLESRNHKVLIYQQADSDYFCHLTNPRLNLLKKYTNFINGLQWCSIQWQHEQGVPPNPGEYENKYGQTPMELRHRQAGHHQKLNEFLTKYIKDNKILE